MNEVKDSVEFYRSLWAGAEARLAESQAEVARLRAALVPGGLQVADSYANDSQRAIDTAYVGGWNACRDAMRAALKPAR